MNEQVTMTEQELLSDFISYAKCLHQDQKYGNEPYHNHLDRTLKLIETHVENATLEQKQVAYGHDLIEDTEASIETIAEAGCCLVAEAIDLITDPILPNRTERKELAYTFFKECGNSEAKVLAATAKFADRADNLTSSINQFKETKNARHLRKYLDEHKRFVETYEDHCNSASLKQLLSDLHGEALALVA